MEVIPKLTQAILAPRSTLVGRPATANIDKFLFARSLATPHEGRSPLEQLVGSAILGASVFEEARRIQALGAAARHEAIGAFVAGLQGALLLTGGAAFVGASGPGEGYYALPRRWHSDWKAAWQDSARPNDTVRVVPCEAYLARQG